MEQYIPKSALVAKINNRIQESIDAGGATRGVYLSERMKEDSYILSIIDTLKTKEVDLEKEIDDWYNTKASKEFENVLYRDIENCAKHFFELGLKAQKGE